MPDFLTKLLDRTLERVPLLERRRPSMFEPSTGPPVPALGGPDEAIDSPAPHVRNAAPVNEGDLRPKKTIPDTPAVPNQEMPPHAAPPSEFVFPKPAPRPWPPDASEPFSQAAESSVHLVEHLRTIEHLHTETIVERHFPAAFPRQELSAGSDLKRTPRGSAEADANTIQNSRRYPAGEAETPADRPARASSAVPGQSAAEAIPLKTRVPASLLPVLPVPAKSSVLKSATPPSVTAVPAQVHVSIGRIEIRAAGTPAVPQRPARLRAPRTSLEEYLAQRNGGAR